MKVLVTGGTGYIGSHTCIQLIENNIIPVILDNLYNSKLIVLERIEKVTGVKPIFYQGDIGDAEILKTIFSEHDINGVIHFAGLKAVGESVEKPLAYYMNNVSGTLNLINEINIAGIKTLIFSSSATVYGDPTSVPINENAPTSATNPYGRSKLMAEEILSDFQKANPEMSVTLLRYFNPVGAHQSGCLGEDPIGKPNNLLPFIAQVAAGQRNNLGVFGADYDTCDGTGVRDYIHVVDLSDGHIAALKKVGSQQGLHVFNLGTGFGSSVLEMISAFEKVSKLTIPYVVLPRRDGDIAECWADTSYAQEILGWKAQRTLITMVEDSWRWQSMNPDGYC